MKLRVFTPRLLPLTIAIMAALLAVKSVSLVRAAVPANPPAAGVATQATPPPPSQPASPPATPPSKPAPGAAAPATSAAVPQPAAKAPAANSADKQVEVIPPPQPPVSDTERALLLDLRHRREELDAREAALASRESVLAAAEKRLQARVGELTALQKKLEDLEAARKQRDDANWAGLVKLYENMKPRDAATIFNDLDLPVLLQVLDRMNERKAAPVLAAMQPERARQVTEQLAELRRKANSPANAGSGS